jgi:hypothetical protein
MPAASCGRFWYQLVLGEDWKVAAAASLAVDVRRTTRGRVGQGGQRGRSACGGRAR